MRCRVGRKSAEASHWVVRSVVVIVIKNNSLRLTYHMGIYGVGSNKKPDTAAVAAVGAQFVAGGDTMIIVLNGYPGVGKLTIGRLLAEKLKGRLLDIHTVYNVAFALTEFKSPEFRDAVERVEAIAHDLALKRPDQEPLVMTTVLAGQSAWGDAEWGRMVALGDARPPFCVVHIHCDITENTRRIQSPDRGAMHKPRDPSYVHRNHAEAKLLYGTDVTHLLRLDTTQLTATDAADAIADWVGGLDH